MFAPHCAVEDSVVGLRTHIGRGSRVTRSVLLGADLYPPGDGSLESSAFGIGRNVVLDRVIIDKNARIGDGTRLVNEGNLQEANGEGYYIRGGIIIVPKGGVIEAGLTI